MHTELVFIPEVVKDFDYSKTYYLRSCDHSGDDPFTNLNNKNKDIKLKVRINEDKSVDIIYNGNFEFVGVENILIEEDIYNIMPISIPDGANVFNLNNSYNVYVAENFTASSNYSDYLYSSETLKDVINAGAIIPKNRSILKDVIEYRGSIFTLKYLIEEQNVDVAAFDNIALKTALNYNDLSVIKYLIEKGARVNSIEGIRIEYASIKEFMTKEINKNLRDDLLKAIPDNNIVDTILKVYGI